MPPQLVTFRKTTWRKRGRDVEKNMHTDTADFAKNITAYPTLLRPRLHVVAPSLQVREDRQSMGAPSQLPGQRAYTRALASRNAQAEYGNNDRGKAHEVETCSVHAHAITLTAGITAAHRSDIYLVICM